MTMWQWLDVRSFQCSFLGAVRPLREGLVVVLCGGVLPDEPFHVVDQAIGRDLQSPDGPAQARFRTVHCGQPATEVDLETRLKDLAAGSGRTSSGSR
jgi:hypothetical protein